MANLVKMEYLVFKVYPEKKVLQACLVLLAFLAIKDLRESKETQSEIFGFKFKFCLRS